MGLPHYVLAFECIFREEQWEFPKASVFTMNLEMRSYLGLTIPTKKYRFSGGKLNFALTFLSEKWLQVSHLPGKIQQKISGECGIEKSSVCIGDTFCYAPHNFPRERK